jgi:cytochrome c oxidase subunit 3
MKAPVVDLRELPDYAFGHRMPIWWGTVFFMVIEGSGFLMLIAAYLYLFAQNPDWPPVGRLPDPLPGAVLIALMLLSEMPNFWLKRVCRRFDTHKVQAGLVLMSLIALGGLGIRAWEFQMLELRWDENAFASMIWALLFVHTTHLVVDAAETWVMAAMSFIGPLDARRFVDFVENAEYWDFVVLSWIGVYVALYWLPRWWS